jgi:polyisoprenoid-binding protein YceI
MSKVEVAQRTLEGTPVPDAGTYSLDPAHTYAGFRVRHLMVAKVRGRFAAVSGTVVIGEDPLKSSVEVSIETASIDTGQEHRDAQLRSPDFFDAEQYPTMTFASTGIRPTGATKFEMDGVLTIKGVSKPVTLTCRLEGMGRDPWGNDRAGFSARTTIDREAWGIAWNQPLETGGVLIGNTVAVEIEAEIVRN